MKYAKTLGSIALAALLVSGFSGCSDGGSDAVTGYYLDSAVENVDYTTADGGTFQTGADGSFTCKSGTSVTFKIGNLVLRTISDVADGQKVIENDPAVITLLQSVDADGDSSNGIQITEEVKVAVIAWLGDATSIDNNDSNDGKLDNIEALETALAEAGVTGATTVTLADAEAHVETTLAAELASSTTAGLGTQVIVGDTINYVDYKGEVRKAPLNAAAAEYHTGNTYGSTLFDSPKNKCQNCHNELYDTWKDSMHGKSWTDPVFQSKFQDFLRTHLAKIGETKDILYEQKTIIDGDGVGADKNMFSSGAAPTCIKCHAPGAYYANDYKVTVTELPDSADLNSTQLADLKEKHEVSAPTGETVVIAANSHQNKVYKATFQIGHESNLEGISCAFCHSIETPRMMVTGETYTIKKALRSGPHGPVVRAAGLITAEANASSSVMNNFFRLWGPEKPLDYNATSKATDNADLRAAGDKGGDGRYGMTSKDINGTNGKIHYTGGPFYGPYGVSGKSNENSTDATDRLSHISADFNKTENNHFGMTGAITAGNAGDHGKTLCLSCHQRSAGAKSAEGQFMELCSTQMAVTTGGDTPGNDSLSSPKCQKCHMERIEGVLLHKWARPDLRYAASDFDALPYDLTPQLDEADTTISDGNNPQRDGWFNSHAFLGASKTGHKTSVTAKIKSGFSADVTTSNDGTTLTVTTTITNKTAHMFPGAHPMRRTLSRVIVTDGNGDELNVSTATGLSTFDDIENNVTALAGKTLHSSALSLVPVNENGSAALTFPGKVLDLSGAVSSHRFASKEDNGSVIKVNVAAVDATVKSQVVTSGKTVGKVFNSAITNSSDASMFTRIYGHETGKKYDSNGDENKTDGTFVVRPGFDSNTVAKDNRLSPNETETYTTTYNISGKSGVSTTYKIYYMQKGANGQFIDGDYTDKDTNISYPYPSDQPAGWLNQAASDSQKFLVTEVFTKTVTE